MYSKSRRSFDGHFSMKISECAEIMNSSTRREIVISSSRNTSITARGNEKSEEQAKESGLEKDEQGEKEEKWEDEWKDEEEYIEDENVGLKRRKKRNAPVMIEEAVSMKSKCS